MSRITAILFSVATAGMLAGCGGSAKQPATAPATRMATDIDPATAETAYWLARPGTVTLRARNYDYLMSQCEQVLRSRFFQIDSVIYRDGTIQTEPLISKQFWEVWRSDVVEMDDLAASSLATYRRTVKCQISKVNDTEYQAAIWAVVERASGTPRRVTAVTHYRSALTGADSQAKLSSPQLRSVPEGKWYATGRDLALEQVLADDIKDRLGYR